MSNSNSFQSDQYVQWDWGNGTAKGQIVERFERVTPGLIRRTAQEWLRPDNRTVITLEAAGGGS